MTVYNLNFSDGNAARPTPSGWNEVLVTTLGHAQTLLDDVDSDNGVSLEIITAYTGATGGGVWADTDLYGFPRSVWQSAFYGGSGLGAIDISGLPVGGAYTLQAIGHTNNASRDADFTVEGVTKRYDNTATSAERTAPVEFTGTIPGDGIISLSQDIVSIFAYCNGIILDVTAVASGPTITGPDTTTEGSATVATGTDLDTVTTFSLISGSNSVVQTIDSATATTLNYVARSGVSLCTPSTPVAGLPLEPTISAAGITPYVVQQEAE